MRDFSEIFDRIDAKDIKLKSAEVQEYIKQMVDFHASRLDKNNPYKSIDIINEFLES